MHARILIADDQADLRALVRRALERDGRFRIVGEASDGAEAVQHASRHQPDLVLLDLSMPHMDGLEALPLVRQASPAARIAVYSGFERHRVAPLVHRLGADAYLEKGTHPWVLADELWSLLGRPQTPLPQDAPELAEARERLRALI